MVNPTCMTNVELSTTFTCSLKLNILRPKTLLKGMHHQGYFLGDFYIKGPFVSRIKF